MVKIESKIKKIIENNPVVVATIMKKRKPNAVAVAFVKVVDNKVVITDNFMNQTVKDLKENDSVCLLVWNKELQGYKIIGSADYFISGRWIKFVKSIKENKKLSAKGAIVMKVKKIIKLF